MPFVNGFGGTRLRYNVLADGAPIPLIGGNGWRNQQVILAHIASHNGLAKVIIFSLPVKWRGQRIWNRVEVRD